MIVNIAITGHQCQFDLVDWLKYCKWGMSVCIKPDGYKTLVFTTGPHKTRLVCRILLEAPADKEVDHQNGNTLNNSRNNIRLATSQQQKFNTSPRDSTGLSKGVIKHGSGFKVTITVDGKQIYLGTFRSAEYAGQKYKEAADKYFGEFALHNSR